MHDDGSGAHGTQPTGSLVVRPMRLDDVAAAERLSAEAFLAVDVAARRPGQPEPLLRPPSRAEAWRTRTARLLVTDPGGCWVAEHLEGPGAGLTGFATSYVREGLWGLATFAVRPGRQGAGTGRLLLGAATHHGRGCLRAMLSASADPRAFRLYHSAGFTLHPQMSCAGVVDRAALPVVERVREATPADRDLMDSVDRRTRGAAHGDHHDLLALQGRALVSDTATGQGYTWVDAHGGVLALAATSRRTASRLLWAALAGSSGPVVLPHVTAANRWALDVALAARLVVSTEGYLGVRGMAPPAPYVHHGALL